MLARVATIALVSLLLAVAVHADDRATYTPAKVVYDLSSPNPVVLGHLLDRMSMLQNLYGNDPLEASIVVVVHEGAIPLFSNRSQVEHAELMRRAASLVMGEIVAFRLCRASARMQGFHEGEFPAHVTLVPMADAEMAKLQGEGYAYLQ